MPRFLNRATEEEDGADGEGLQEWGREIRNPVLGMCGARCLFDKRVEMWRTGSWTYESETQLKS